MSHWSRLTRIVTRGQGFQKGTKDDAWFSRGSSADACLNP